MKKRNLGKEGVKAALKEINACREDMADMFMKKWAKRGVDPINGCIAMAHQLGVVTRLLGMSRADIREMVNSTIDSADITISKVDLETTGGKEEDE
jgi:ribosomal protein S14